jgi:hypothetical protein
MAPCGPSASRRSFVPQLQDGADPPARAVHHIEDLGEVTADESPLATHAREFHAHTLGNCPDLLVAVGRCDRPPGVLLPRDCKAADRVLGQVVPSLLVPRPRGPIQHAPEPLEISGDGAVPYRPAVLRCDTVPMSVNHASPPLPDERRELPIGEAPEIEPASEHGTPETGGALVVPPPLGCALVWTPDLAERFHDADNIRHDVREHVGVCKRALHRLEALAGPIAGLGLVPVSERVSCAPAREALLGVKHTVRRLVHAHPAAVAAEALGPPFPLMLRHGDFPLVGAIPTSG